MRAWRADYLRDGLVIARKFMDEATLSAMQFELENIVDTYARRLSVGGRLAGSPNQRADQSRGLDFSHRYTALYEANLRSKANGGKRSDLPAFFRAEGHTPGMHKFLMHARLHELIRCLLPHEAEMPPALKLYPVYMMRGKVPDAISKSAMTVDWHQDAEYTYYWYSGLNASLEDIDHCEPHALPHACPVLRGLHPALFACNHGGPHNAPAAPALDRCKLGGQHVGAGDGHTALAWAGPADSAAAAKTHTRRAAM